MAKRGKKTPPSDTIDSKATQERFKTGKGKPENWANKLDSDAYKEASKLYPLIQKQYENQEDQAQKIEEYWCIFNAQPDENQQYSGNSNCYVPAVRDCINARAKRSVKQLFPVTQKHVDAISADADIPYPQLSLIEHYITSTRLKALCRSVLVAGDVTGQWNLYVDWTKSYRRVTDIIKKPPMLEVIDGESVSDLGLEDPLAEDEEELETSDVVEEGPDIVEFATEDLAVVPPTCKSINKAQAVALRLRMSEEKVDQMVDEGVFVLPDGSGSAKDYFQSLEKGVIGSQKKNPPRKMTADAGVRTEGSWKYALIYETQAKLTFESGKPKENAFIYFAGPQQILGIIKSPYWGGKRSILSEPVDAIGGSFFGRSKIEPVKYMQWNLTDFWNMGQDSAMYSLLPVFAADPLKNPNWASMVIGLAAVWPIAPTDIQAIQFPQLYKESLQICDAMERRIWQSMDVNEMMMGRVPSGRKNNAMIGGIQAEQATNIDDNASRFEDVMLNPLVELMFEYDQQFRTDTITVKSFGELGVQANMIPVEPQQWGERYYFTWYGTAFQMGQNMLQQQIAWMNVIKGIPPALLDGRRLSVLPILEAGTENIFGPNVAPKILIDERNMFTVDPDTENEILHNGFPAQVHPGDDDIKHLTIHMRGANLSGDPLGHFKMHMGDHMTQLQKKRQMAAVQEAQMQAGAPGGPGGAGQPGVAGTPRPGALPGPPKPMQQPAGAVHADQMVDPSVAGRG